ncbi:hypothetical protein E2C01_079174 [Portunus trituberculatus]|uniref:Uncharacterized protein n=1 Tax=Portunus trituberculatus TaxID=210409 RepID=A0A5B7IS20_PORTR|nr:hypothetical protein [Portunus trituberculatus]
MNGINIPALSERNLFIPSELKCRASLCCSSLTAQRGHSAPPLASLTIRRDYYDPSSLPAPLAPGNQAPPKVMAISSLACHSLL